jgi:predicted ATPase
VAPLPAELNSFVGRESELRQLGELLSQSRLLTLTGAGGVGKTRLALRLATQTRTMFADGVMLVELASVTDSSFVPQTLAAVLGVERQPGREVMAQLVDVLREAHALLVIDNCEHLVAACADMVEALLRSCTHLVVLAASREPLRIAGETTWRVPSLSVPGRTVPLKVDHLIRFEAVRLFVDRARAALPAFVLSEETAPATARVCRVLGGIPLALELAAPRLRVLSVQQLAEMLDGAVEFLAAGSRTALPRQQTLRATLDWSYALLTGPEQRLFDRVSTFVGGWTLEAAEAITAADEHDKNDVLDVLAGLVDKSLVLAEPGEDGKLRYRLLETLRQYGQEHLATAGHAEEVSCRHAGSRGLPRSRVISQQLCTTSPIEVRSTAGSVSVQPCGASFTCGEL